MKLNSANHSILVQTEDKQIFSKKSFKVVSKKKPNKFYAKLEKVRTANSNDFGDDNSSKESKKFKPSKIKSKPKNNRSQESSKGPSNKANKKRSSKKPLASKIFKSN